VEVVEDEQPPEIHPAKEEPDVQVQSFEGKVSFKPEKPAKSAFLVQIDPMVKALKETPEFEQLLKDYRVSDVSEIKEVNQKAFLSDLRQLAQAKARAK